MSKCLISGRCPLCRVRLCEPNSPLCWPCQEHYKQIKCSQFFPGICASCKAQPQRKDMLICEECHKWWIKEPERCPVCMELRASKDGCLCEACDAAYKDMMVSTFLPGMCGVCKVNPREIGYTMCNQCFLKWRPSRENCPNCHKPRVGVRSAFCAECEKTYHEMKVNVFLPGLCAACKVNAHVIGYTLCDCCFRWWTESGRERCPNCHNPRGDVETALCAVCEKGYNKMKAATVLPGKCAACKINPPKKGFTMCGTCFSNFQANREVCPMCAKPHGEAKTALCKDCHKAYTEMQATTFVPGKCAVCKVDPHEPGYTMCRPCFIKWSPSRANCPNCQKPRGDVVSALCAECESAYHLALICPPPPARGGAFIKGRCARCKANPITRENCDLCDRCYRYWNARPPMCAVCLEKKLGHHPVIPGKRSDICSKCYEEWKSAQSSK